MAIPAFNGRLDFATAFAWNFIQIRDFLNSVADNPDDYRERDPAHPTQPYPDPDTDRTHQNLDLLCSNIIALGPPDGTKYTDPTPMQSMLHKFRGVTLDPTDDLVWQVNNNAKPFFIIFDLLGIFLSIIGPALTTNQAAPTAQNYFLPLVALHVEWCSTLVGGSALAPKVAQITWARQDDTIPWVFFLGPSAKGWFQAEEEVERPVQIAWQVLAQKTRYSYMTDSGLFNPDYVWGTSPTFADRGIRGARNFGNCAETYPFLYLINGGMPANNIFGISIKTAATFICGVNWTRYWALNATTGNPLGMKPPCPNCAHMMVKFNAVKANFELYKNE